MDYLHTDFKNLTDVEYDPNKNNNLWKDENLYKYHENTQLFDPRSQPFSYFYVTVSGQI